MVIVVGVVIVRCDEVVDRVCGKPVWYSGRQADRRCGYLSRSRLTGDAQNQVINGRGRPSQSNDSRSQGKQGRILRDLKPTTGGSWLTDGGNDPTNLP